MVKMECLNDPPSKGTGFPARSPTIKELERSRCIDRRQTQDLDLARRNFLEADFWGVVP